MHPNAAFRWEDRDALRALAREIGFGILRRIYRIAGWEW